MVSDSGFDIGHRFILYRACSSLRSNNAYSNSSHQHVCRCNNKFTLIAGLPQTRQRKYLFVWKSDDPNDDLGDYFKEILDFLKEPIVHSIEAFFLPPSHDRIRQFREALRSGPGQLLARDRAREPDFWDWKNKNKDTPRHVRFRRDNGIDELSRWFTGWGTSNHLECAPNLMPELLDAWNGRRLDMIECFGAAAMRDVTARDANHHLVSITTQRLIT